MNRRDYLRLFFCFSMFAGSLLPSDGAEPVREVAPGSAERKAIMEALRGPVSKHVGKRVTFTGSAKVSGGWAVFNGGAAPTDGVTPKNEDVAFELELDLFALLRKEDGEWKVLYFAFAGDVGPMQEAREKFPEIPKSLVPVIP